MKTKNDRVELTWEVDDGYAGPSAPQHTSLYLSEIESCETLDEAVSVAEQSIRDDFPNHVSPSWDDTHLREQVEELWKLKQEQEE